MPNPSIDLLKAIGDPQTLQREADAVNIADVQQRVNAHIHLPPNFSAFDNVQQAVDLAHEQKVGVLGVSNYYDYHVYDRFIEAAHHLGVFPLYGIEIICMIDRLRDAGAKLNDPGNPGKMYLCGKGLTRFHNRTDKADALLNRIRNADRARMKMMIDLARNVLAQRGLETDIDENSVIDMVVGRHGSPRETVYLQERHIAQAFCDAIVAATPTNQRLDRLAAVFGSPSKAESPDDVVTMQTELRSHLLKAGKPAFVDESFLNEHDAASLILEMGGIPCYPVLADGAPRISEFEQTPAALIDNLGSLGIHTAEFIPLRNASDVLTTYVPAMREAGLVVTAGTEHNTLDLSPMAPACSDGSAIPQAAEAIFWEGACVCAAHQFLMAHGQPGYVQADGRLNPDFPDAEARIDAFARLGAVVIRTYQAQARAAHGAQA